LLYLLEFLTIWKQKIPFQNHFRAQVLRFIFNVITWILNKFDYLFYNNTLKLKTSERSNLRPCSHVLNFKFPSLIWSAILDMKVVYYVYTERAISFMITYAIPKSEGVLWHFFVATFVVTCLLHLLPIDHHPLGSCTSLVPCSC
jgi:hypothetical protein